MSGQGRLTGDLMRAGKIAAAVLDIYVDYDRKLAIEVDNYP